MRVAEATLGPWGWSGHPQKPKTHFSFILFLFLLLFLAFWGWPDYALSHGGGSTTPKPAIGATPWLKMAHLNHSITLIKSLSFNFFNSIYDVVKTTTYMM
jgi:hypothetical protein